MFKFLMLIIITASWILFSGHFTSMLLGLGVVSVIITMYLLSKTAIFTKSKTYHYINWNWVFYLPWLIYQIFKSAFTVLGIVWSKNLKISPTFAEVKTSINNETGKVIYANSITLTPGTYVIEINEGSFLVHALEESSYHDLKDGLFEDKILRLSSKRLHI